MKIIMEKKVILEACRNAKLTGATTNAPLLNGIKLLDAFSGEFSNLRLF